MPRFRPVIRVFVSSTFSDLKPERNALQALVFPKLEQLCAQNGFQFQAIDLRWGVSSEAGLDHRTMRICFDELRRAQEISPRPNFLILLGNRYGWRPLPEEISVAEFQALEYAAAQVASSTAAAVLREWYRKDDNAVPPVYLLQSRRQQLPDAKDYTQDAPWNEVQAILWEIINRAQPSAQLRERFDEAALAEGSPPAIVRFQASATEQEIWHGALRAPDAHEHVLAFFRQIENVGEFSDPTQIKDFVDVQSDGKVDAKLWREQKLLKEALKPRLGEKNVFAGSARLVPTRDAKGQPTAEVTTDHLAQLCTDVEKRMTEIFQAQFEEYWNKTAQASAERAARELKIEQDEHERFGRERGGKDSFIGRETELKTIRDYLQNKSPWPLVVHGASGCGKTALLARAAGEMKVEDGRSKMAGAIVRFIGVTARSSDIRSLLGSLCQELRLRHPREGELPTDTKALSEEVQEHFKSATQEQPLVLFLDALDQLSDADNGRLLSWIPTGQLPPNVKLVVSCLSDRAKDDPASQPFAELTRRQIIAKNLINLDALSEAEARKLLFDCWLPQARRTVSPEQAKRIEQRLASPACCQPIYLKLLFEEARLWRSYDAAPELGESVPAILGQLIERLSQPANHGSLLVERVLGYLAASRHGLAENEILEILFVDPEYKAALDQATEQTRHELPASATRIPVAIWSRLRFELAPYLAERAAPGANVLTFYHRQVAEWGQEHFVKASEHTWQPHRRLADFFRKLADPKANRSWNSPQVRPLVALAFHLARTDPQALADLLFDFNWLQAKSVRGLVREMLDDFAESVAVLPAADPVRSELTIVQNCIRLASHILMGRGSELASQLIGRTAWTSGKNIARLTAAAAAWRGAPWFMPLNRNLLPPEGPLLQTIETGTVDHVVVTPDGQFAACSAGGTLFFLNIQTGAKTCGAAAHAESISPLCVERNGAHVYSAGCDYIVRRWNIRTGVLLDTTPSAVGKVSAIAIAPDNVWLILGSEDGGLVFLHPGTRAETRPVSIHDGKISAICIAGASSFLTASWDGTIKVWDYNAGTVRFVLRGHTAAVTGLAVSEASGWIVSGSMDGTVRTWDLQTGRPIRTIDTLSGAVYSVCATADGHLILAASEPGDIPSGSGGVVRLFDPEAEEPEIAVMSGHTADVWSVAITPSGTLAVTGSWDGTVKVWDTSDPESIDPTALMPIGMSDWVSALCFGNQDATLVAGTSSGEFAAWNGMESDYLRHNVPSRNWILATGFIQEANFVVTVDRGGWLTVWSCVKGVPVKQIRLFTPAADVNQPEDTTTYLDKATDAIITTDAKTVVTSECGGPVVMWNVDGDAPPAILREACDTRHVITTRNGWLAIASMLANGGTQYTILNINSRVVHRTWASQAVTRVRAIELSPDCKLLLAVEETELVTWSLAVRKVLRRRPLVNFGRHVKMAGSWLFSCGNHLDCFREDGDLQASFTGEGGFESIAATADGRTIAIGEESGRIHILRLVLPGDPPDPLLPRLDIASALRVQKFLSLCHAARHAEDCGDTEQALQRFEELERLAPDLNDAINKRAMATALFGQARAFRRKGDEITAATQAKMAAMFAEASDVVIAAQITAFIGG